MKIIPWWCRSLKVKLHEQQIRQWDGILNLSTSSDTKHLIMKDCQPPAPNIRTGGLPFCSQQLIFIMWTYLVYLETIFRTNGTLHAAVQGRSLKIKIGHYYVLCVSTSRHYGKPFQNVILRTAIVSNSIAAVWRWFWTELIWRAIHVTWVFECLRDMPNNDPNIS